MTEREKRLEAKLCTVDCVMQKGAIEIIKQEIKDFADELKIKGYYNKTVADENKYLLYDKDFDELLKERGIE